MDHAHSHGHDTNIVEHQQVEEGDDHEHQHGKKSVLKKVKAKAKKIKDTIAKHVHHDGSSSSYSDDDHDHDNGHSSRGYNVKDASDDHDLDEEYDEDEMVKDPEIHGAPIYESAAVSSSVPGQREDLRRPGIAYERSRVPMDEDPLMSSSVPVIVDNNEKHRVNFGHTTVMGEGFQATQNTPVFISHHSRETVDPTNTFVPGQVEYPGQPKVKLETPSGLEEDPAASKDNPDAFPTTNYQTKVFDPTGEGEEVTGITPILHSLDKMKIYDEQDTGREQNLPQGTHTSSSNLPLSTGSHDHFTPEPTPPNSANSPENPKPVSESPNTTKLDEGTYGKLSYQSGSLTEKISSATSAIADKAVSAKKAVASKIGYGENKNSRNELCAGGEETHQRSPNQSSYTEKISSATSAIADKAASAKNIVAATVTEKLTPAYKKVAGAGTAVMSKMPGSNSGTAHQHETGPIMQDKGVSVKDYLAEKLRPGEEDKALSEVISGALHVRKEKGDGESRPVVKVTESKEVEKRLGGFNKKDEEKVRSGIANSPGTGVVDKIKGAVTSWFSNEEAQRIQQANAGPGNEEVSSYGREDAGRSSNPVGERRLQESCN
ncbi:hypothetical protein SLE2022_401960 [Rubroshorea leprosula]